MNLMILKVMVRGVFVVGWRADWWMIVPGVGVEMLDIVEEVAVVYSYSAYILLMDDNHMMGFSVETALAVS